MSFPAGSGGGGPDASFDDPFGFSVSTTSSGTQAQQPSQASAGVDDPFGDFGVPVTTAVPAATASPATIDDPFADFAPVSSPQTTAGTQASSTSEFAAFDDPFGDIQSATKTGKPTTAETQTETSTQTTSAPSTSSAFDLFGFTIEPTSTSSATSGTTTTPTASTSNGDSLFSGFDAIFGSIGATTTPTATTTIVPSNATNSTDESQPSSSDLADPFATFAPVDSVPAEQSASPAQDPFASQDSSSSPAPRSSEPTTNLDFDVFGTSSTETSQPTGDSTFDTANEATNDRPQMDDPFAEQVRAPSDRSVASPTNSDEAALEPTSLKDESLPDQGDSDPFVSSHAEDPFASEVADPFGEANDSAGPASDFTSSASIDPFAQEVASVTAAQPVEEAAPDQMVTTVEVQSPGEQDPKVGAETGDKGSKSPAAADAYDKPLGVSAFVAAFGDEGVSTTIAAAPLIIGGDTGTGAANLDTIEAVEAKTLTDSEPQRLDQPAIDKEKRASVPEQQTEQEAEVTQQDVAVKFSIVPSAGDDNNVELAVNFVSKPAEASSAESEQTEANPVEPVPNQTDSVSDEIASELQSNEAGDTTELTPSPVESAQVPETEVIKPADINVDVDEWVPSPAQAPHTPQQLQENDPFSPVTSDSRQASDPFVDDFTSFVPEAGQDDPFASIGEPESVSNAMPDVSLKYLPEDTLTTPGEEPVTAAEAVETASAALSKFDQLTAERQRTVSIDIDSVTRVTGTISVSPDTASDLEDDVAIRQPSSSRSVDPSVNPEVQALQHELMTLRRQLSINSCALLASRKQNTALELEVEKLQKELAELRRQRDDDSQLSRVLAENYTEGPDRKQIQLHQRLQLQLLQEQVKKARERTEAVREELTKAILEQKVNFLNIQNARKAKFDQLKVMYQSSATLAATLKAQNESLRQQVDTLQEILNQDRTSISGQQRDLISAQKARDEALQEVAKLQERLAKEILEVKAVNQTELEKARQQTLAAQAEVAHMESEMQRMKNRLHAIELQEQASAQIHAEIVTEDGGAVYTGNPVMLSIKGLDQADCSITWFRTAAASDYVPIPGSSAQGRVYTPTVDDLYCTLRAQIIHRATGAIASAEIGPVLPSAELVTAVSEALKKTEIDFNVLSDSSSANSNKKEDSRQICINRKRIKFQRDHKTLYKKDLSANVKIHLKALSFTKFSLTLDESQVSLACEANSPFERDVIAAVIRMIVYQSVYLKDPTPEKVREKLHSLLYMMNFINIPSSEPVVYRGTAAHIRKVEKRLKVPSDDDKLTDQEVEQGDAAAAVRLGDSWTTRAEATDDGEVLVVNTASLPGLQQHQESNAPGATGGETKQSTPEPEPTFDLSTMEGRMKAAEYEMKKAAAQAEFVPTDIDDLFPTKRRGGEGARGFGDLVTPDSDSDDDDAQGGSRGAGRGPQQQQQGEEAPRKPVLNITIKDADASIPIAAVNMSADEFKNMFADLGKPSTGASTLQPLSLQPPARGRVSRAISVEEDFPTTPASISRSFNSSKRSTDPQTPSRNDAGNTATGSAGDDIDDFEPGFDEPTPPINPPPTVAAPPVDDFDVDFSDFDAQPNQPSSNSADVTTSSAPTERAKPAQTQAATFDDWDAFGELSQPSVPAAETASAVNPSLDPFGDFGAAAPAQSDPFGAPEPVSQSPLADDDFFGSDERSANPPQAATVESTTAISSSSDPFSPDQSSQVDFGSFELTSSEAQQQKSPAAEEPLGVVAHPWSEPQSLTTTTVDLVASASADPWGDTQAQSVSGPTTTATTSTVDDFFAEVVPAADPFAESAEMPASIDAKSTSEDPHALPILMDDPTARPRLCVVERVHAKSSGFECKQLAVWGDLILYWENGLTKDVSVMIAIENHALFKTFTPEPDVLTPALGYLVVNAPAGTTQKKVATFKSRPTIPEQEHGLCEAPIVGSLRIKQVKESSVVLELEVQGRLGNVSRTSSTWKDARCIEGQLSAPGGWVSVGAVSATVTLLDATGTQIPIDLTRPCKATPNYKFEIAYTRSSVGTEMLPTVELPEITNDQRALRVELEVPVADGRVGDVANASVALKTTCQACDGGLTMDLGLGSSTSVPTAQLTSLSQFMAATAGSTSPETIETTTAMLIEAVKGSVQYPVVPFAGILSQSRTGKYFIETEQ